MEDNLIKIKVDKIEIEGNLVLPKGVKGLAIFAHGSGSSRHSVRNQFVAKELQKGQLGTLLIDLLTHEEELVDRETAHLRFDIPFLAKRLVAIVDWLSKQKETQSLKMGYFGASTGAAAALQAAAMKGDHIYAIVSRGGRPDLAGSTFLSAVKAPVLLIVGGEDYPVDEMNREALKELTCEKKLVIVPRATHLFEEPGALEEVAKLARDWFTRHLA